MAEPLPEIQIPERPAFKSAEVCELLKLQPYVLRSWENEFKDLGVSKTPGGPRIYRRADVERAVRIRQLVFGEGLTLAGVRRRFDQEKPAEPDTEFEDLVDTAAARGVDERARARMREVRVQLRSLLERLRTEPMTTPRLRDVGERGTALASDVAGGGSDGVSQSAEGPAQATQLAAESETADFVLASPALAPDPGETPTVRPTKRPRAGRRSKAPTGDTGTEAGELPVEPAQS